MERRGLACGNTVMHLRASFPVERWRGARGGDFNAPVRIGLRITSCLCVGLGQALPCQPSEFPFESTLGCFLTPNNGQGIISYLVFQMGHPNPWVAQFLEMEISGFTWQAALVARQIRSHGFDLVADVYIYFQVLAFEEMVFLDGVPGFFLEEGPGGAGGEVSPPALLRDAEEVDGVIIFSLGEGPGGAGGEVSPPTLLGGAEEVDGVLIFSLEEGPGEVSPPEDIDGVFVLSAEEELLVAGGGEMACDPATSSEIESLRTVRYNKDEKDDGTSQEACPICCEDYEPQMLLKMMPLCSHTFHDHCLLRWLEKSRACPLCRTKITIA